MDGSRPISRTLIGPLARYAAAFACAIALSVPVALAQSGGTMISMSDMKPGSPPGTFKFAHTGQGSAGQWSVVLDPTASGGRAIEQTSTDRTDYRFPLAIHERDLPPNVDVELRFKAISGKVDQAAGIAVRVRDKDNYYVVRANALEDNVRFYRVVNGRREQLEGANLKVTPNEWHALGLKAEGSQFTVTYDGKTLYRAADKTFDQGGKVALWTKADSVTRFDQIKVTPLP
jgi:hypothetical protein